MYRLPLKKLKLKPTGRICEPYYKNQYKLSFHLSENQSIEFETDCRLLITSGQAVENIIQSLVTLCLCNKIANCSSSRFYL